MVRTTAKAVNDGELAELNIGLMCTVGPGVLAKMLDEFQLAHPTVSIILHDVAPDSIQELLLSGALDAVFCTHRGDFHKQINYVELFEEPLVVAFAPGHAFSDLKSVPLSELTKQKYVERLHCEFREDIIECCNERDLEIDVAIRSQRDDWIQGFVRGGTGVTCIPLHSVVLPELDFRRIVDPCISRTLYFATTKIARPLPAIRLLIDEVKNYSWPELE
jgi:DNA-binding transcriptional LysR family regulator